jgi:hypothetical protein
VKSGVGVESLAIDPGFRWPLHPGYGFFYFAGHDRM